MTRARNISNPQAVTIPLTVSANITSNASLSVGNTTITGNQFVNGAVTFANSTSNSIYFVANGNVGIGNSTPTYKLTVDATANSSVPVMRLNAGSNTAWQRGLQIFSSTMASNDSLMIQIGKADSNSDSGQIYYYKGTSNTANRLSFGLYSIDDVLNVTGNARVGINNTSPTSTLHLTGTQYTSGNTTIDGKVTVKQFQISRDATNAALWWQEGNLDENHVLWNDYYGGPLSKGAGGSGFDGMKWNLYKGIHLRTGLNGQYNSLLITGSGASTNDHQVYLYGANDLKLNTTTDDGITIQRDLYITGSTGGSYANRLIIGGTTTPYTAQDTNLRPTFYMTGAYPVITLNTNTTTNASHGPTLQFTCNGTGSQFVIGTNGTGSLMSMGYSNISDWNPHNGIAGYQGTSFFQAGTDGYIGIGALGDWGPSGGYGGSVPNYNLHFIGRTNGTNGHAALFRNIGSGNAGNGNGAGFLFLHDYGDHSWGIVTELRINNTAGTDRPSLLFSNGYDSKTWTCGYGYADSDYFRINIDHGHRNGNWGTTRFTLDRSGNLTIGGSLTQNSDSRIKHNINNITDALTKVQLLNGVTFNYNDDNRPGVGLIAQDVEQLYPELIHEVPTPVNGVLKTYKSVAYGNLVGLLVEAIKELNAKVEALEANNQ